MHETERGDYQHGQKLALDDFCGKRFFKDALPADKSLVMKIMCDPVAAFGDYPPRSGWEEFQWICHFGAEIYSLAALKDPSVEVCFLAPLLSDPLASYAALSLLSHPSLLLLSALSAAMSSSANRHACALVANRPWRGLRMRGLCGSTRLASAA